MKFDEQHRQLRESVLRLIEREINPHVDDWEAAQSFPAHELFKKLGAQGLLGITRPQAYGGMALDFSYAMVLAEALGHIRCGAISMAIGVHTDMCTPALARFGTDDLKHEFLAPAIAGTQIGCIGVSEAHAGSDVAAIKTTARSDGTDYVINGGKMWITNGLQADWMCCLLNTSTGNPHRNKSLVIIPLDLPGVERTRKLHKLGMWASDTAQIFFDEVRVPQRNRIGDEGQGFVMQMMQFQEERLWAAANMVGQLETVIAATQDYTATRRAFGRPVLHNQVVRHRLAELETELEALRALTWRAVEKYVEGSEVTRLASMAKLKAGRLARETADSCLQYWGGIGYMWESPVARFFRDARLASIGGGADEIMLDVICKLGAMSPRSA